MSNEDLIFHNNRLNGIVMFFDKSNSKFKVYISVEKSKQDENFENPVEISEYDLALLKKLICSAESTVRYNSSRIINAHIKNQTFTTDEQNEIIEVVNERLKTEENLRVRALIINILKKHLGISREESTKLIYEALNIENDEFWKFELLIIILSNTGNKGLGKKALSEYKDKNELTEEQENLINKISLQSQIFDFLGVFNNKQQESETVEDEQIVVENKLEKLLDEILNVIPDFVDTDSKVKLVKIGQFFNSHNQGGIKYDEILDEIEKLEAKIGEIPAFSVSEGLLEEERDKRFEYLISELIINSFSSLSSLLGHGLRNPSDFGSEDSILANSLSLLRNYSNETLVNKYCREWEAQYSNFISPIFKKLQENNHLPKSIKDYRSRQSEIDAVYDFAKNEIELKILDFLIGPLDANLRNSLVHYNYYFDKNGRELVYYNRNYRIFRMPINDFALKVYHLLIHRNIFMVRIAQKLSKELGIGWKRREYKKDL